MLARLLPQGDYSLITHELACMGQQTPEALLGESDRRLVCKFLAVPHAVASIFLEGTLATVLHAVLHGAAVVRVHDVAAVARTVRLLEALNSRVETRLPTYEGD